MLLKKINTVRMSGVVYHYYQVNETKRVDFRCKPSNEIETIYLYEKGEDKDMHAYSLQGLYYMENLTPEDEGEIDLIDTDKLIRMVEFDEMEAA